MYENHPLLSELLELCRIHSLNEGKAHLLFELFMELCEMKKLWNIEHHFNDSLKLLYLTAKKEKNSTESDTYVPIQTSETLSPKQIQELQTALSPNSKTLILVFKDQDSSSTYYRVTQDLVKPDSPNTAQRKKFEEKKQFKFEKELEKNRRKLFAQALRDEEET